MCTVCVQLLCKIQTAEKQKLVGEAAVRDFWGRTGTSSYVAQKKRSRSSGEVLKDLVRNFTPSKSPKKKKLKVYESYLAYFIRKY